MLEQYWFLIVAVCVGIIGALAAYYSFGASDPSKRQRLVGFLIAGPFWPSINSYFSHRGGLKGRELVGLLVVIALFVAAVVSSVVFGLGRRGG